MPIVLKRGRSTTLEGRLQAAEYLMKKEGNDRIILCERGIRMFGTSTFNAPDLNAVPMLKEHTRLPAIVDPSHGTVREWTAPALAAAAVAIGADGLQADARHKPQEALSDGVRSLGPHKFERMMCALKAVSVAIGRR